MGNDGLLQLVGWVEPFAKPIAFIDENRWVSLRHGAAVKRSSWTASLFNAGRRGRVGSPRNENIAETLQHRFTPLIAQEDSGANDSPIGFGLRLAFLQNTRVEIEFVVRAYCVRQPQLIPAHSRKDMESWLKPGRQQNEDREGMGAACGQPPKN